ncbi:MAG: Zn-dependent hydrolase, partial [Pedobacter sp.]|nr:Zn-dependent hydrolase [Pedobacter sp.]
MKNLRKSSLIIAACLVLMACNNAPKNAKNQKNTVANTARQDALEGYVAQRLPIYERVKLTTNINLLSTNDRKVLPLLIQAAEIMDDLYWKQAYPSRDSLLATIKDENTRAFLNINYGPWDRLNNDTAFVAGVGPRPAGAYFYPKDITKKEIEQSKLTDKFGAYSVVTRDSSGSLSTTPYHILYASQLQRTSSLLKQAALTTDNKEFKKYLNLRADALVTDDFTASNYAWLD